MFCATQPAMLAICQASGSAIATVPTAIAPPFHSQIAIAPVPTTSVALIAVKRQAEQRDEAQLPAERLGVLVDRLAHEFVLVARRGRTA